MAASLGRRPRAFAQQSGFSPALERSSRAFSRPGGRAAQQSGFTLIEVVVAFALLALALTLLLGALSGAARQIQRASLSGRAALHAQTLLAQVGADGPLQPGHDEGDLDAGRYHWTLDIAPWTEPQGPQAVLVDPSTSRLLELQLSVAWGSRPGERMQWRSLRLAAPEGTPGAAP